MEKLLIINKLGVEDVPPYELLLEADPSKEAIDDYIARGECYTAYNSSKELVGVYVLLKTRPFTIELVNIAVVDKFREKGNARILLEHAINQSRLLGYDMLEVCTGNSSIRQLMIYQKAGFTIYSIDYDFFRRNYSEVIWENGIECRHLIKLRIDIFD